MTIDINEFWQPTKNGLSGIPWVLSPEYPAEIGQLFGQANNRSDPATNGPQPSDPSQLEAGDVEQVSRTTTRNPIQRNVNGRNIGQGVLNQGELSPTGHAAERHSLLAKSSGPGI